MTASDNREDERYIVLNRPDMWRRGLMAGLRELPEGGLALSEKPVYAAHSVYASIELPPGEEPIDFAVGLGPTLYLLREGGQRIDLYDVSAGRWFDMLDFEVSGLQGATRLAYRDGMLYLAAGTGERRLGAISELTGQLVWTANASGDRTGRPWPQASGEASNGPLDWRAGAMAVDWREGSLYVLDRLQRRVLQLDAAGHAVRVFGREELNDAQPSAIAVSAAGDVYVLDSLYRRVHRFRDGAEEGRFGIPLAAPAGMAADADGVVYVGESRPLSDGAEEDRYIHRFGTLGEPLGPLLGYRGPAHKLYIAENGDLYAWNRDRSTIVPLQRRSVLAGGGSGQLIEGYYFSAALDSTEAAMRWHKLVLDATVPDNAQLEVSWLYGEHKRLELQGAVRDLDAYLTDSSVDPSVKAIALNALEWSEARLNPRDMLLSGSGGRYIWLRIRFIASGERSPELRSVTAWCPRQSYLRYLPAVYSEDQNGRDFLERYLSLFETFFSASERTIDRIARWFDADAVSGEYLRWLAGWLHVAYDENWPEEKLRRLLGEIPALYRIRGTREGLLRIIELYTGERPFIVETFQLRCAASSEVRETFVRLFGEDPYRFTVLLKTGQASEESERRTVRRLIEDDKPAHTAASLVPLQPWIYLDRHTYLGVNTYLSRPSSAMEETGGAVIGQDTLLTDDGKSGFVQGKSSVGLDTVLI